MRNLVSYFKLFYSINLGSSQYH